MSFDDKVNKILHEAYFNSPYEKATGIKRQVGLQETDLSMSGLKAIESEHGMDPDSTEFRQREARINGVIERAAQDTADWFEWASGNGVFEGMKERAVSKALVTVGLKAAATDIPDDAKIEVDDQGVVNILNSGTFDGWSLPHFGKLFQKVGDLTTGRVPMSTERVRNIILQAINNVKKLMGRGLYDATDEEGHALEPFEDPNSDKYIGPR